MAFKMKGSRLYGKLKLNRNMDDSSKPDGRSKSSAFQNHGESHEEKKPTYTGKIYENLDKVNEAIKNKDYKKNPEGKYVFNFKGDDGKITTKTLTKH